MSRKQDIDFKIGADLKAVPRCHGKHRPQLEEIERWFWCFRWRDWCLLCNVDAHPGSLSAESVLSLPTKMEGVKVAFDRLNDPQPTYLSCKKATSGTVDDLKLMQTLL
jgi:hypothetical protein